MLGTIVLDILDTELNTINSVPFESYILEGKT